MTVTPCMDKFSSHSFRHGMVYYVSMTKRYIWKYKLMSVAPHQGFDKYFTLSQTDPTQPCTTPPVIYANRPISSILHCIGCKAELVLSRSHGDLIFTLGQWSAILPFKYSVPHQIHIQIAYTYMYASISSFCSLNLKRIIWVFQNEEKHEENEILKLLQNEILQILKVQISADGLVTVRWNELKFGIGGVKFSIESKCLFRRNWIMITWEWLLFCFLHSTHLSVMPAALLLVKKTSQLQPLCYISTFSLDWCMH